MEVQQKQRKLLIIGLLIVGGLAIMPLDVMLSRVFMDGLMPGELRAIFRRAEVFGHAYGIAGIAITIYLLDVSNRVRLPRLILNALAAGLSADLLKVMIWRLRPRGYDWDGGPTFLGTIFTSEHWELSYLLDSDRHSFPSAHTATAVAMAMTLSWMYPKGRMWFAVLAFLCAMNRIDGGAHFPSDVFFGAAVGYVVTDHCFRSKYVNRFLQRWEGRELSVQPEVLPSRAA